MGDQRPPFTPARVLNLLREVLTVDVPPGAGADGRRLGLRPGVEVGVVVAHGSAPRVLSCSRSTWSSAALRISTRRPSLTTGISPLPIQRSSVARLICR